MYSLQEENGPSVIFKGDTRTIYTLEISTELDKVGSERRAEIGLQIGIVGGPKINYVTSILGS